MATISGRGRSAAVRSITRNGNSLTVVIPRVMLYALKLNPREYVLLSLVRGDGFFTVQRAGTETFTPLPRGERSGRVFAYRKITRAGNSLVFAIPTEFRAELNLFWKDELLLVLNREDCSFTVRAWKPHTVGPTKRTDQAGVQEVAP